MRGSAGARRFISLATRGIFMARNLNNLNHLYYGTEEDDPMERYYREQHYKRDSRSPSKYRQRDNKISRQKKRGMERSSSPPPKSREENNQKERPGPHKVTQRQVTLLPSEKPGEKDDLSVGPDEARPKESSKKHKPDPQMQQQEKMKTSGVTPHPEPEQKSKMVNATVTLARPCTSFEEAASSIKVAVLSRDPEKNLSREELMAVEEAFVREILAGAEHKLRFTGIHFRPGMLMVDCVDECTVKWMKEKAPRLQKWEGPTLKACVGEEIPRTYVIEALFPKSINLNNEDVLALVNSQNEDVHTRLWKVLNSKEEVSDKLLTIAVDERSFIGIKKGGNSLFYRFGKVSVSIVKENKKNLEGETAEEGETTVVVAPTPTVQVDSNDQATGLGGACASGSRKEGTRIEEEVFLDMLMEEVPHRLESRMDHTNQGGPNLGPTIPRTSSVLFTRRPENSVQARTLSEQEEIHGARL